MESTGALKAWPMGQNPGQKPLYTLTVPGVDGRTLDKPPFVISCGLEGTAWWSELDSGRRLFDSDARLKQPGVVAVLTYASADRVIREALVTCDDSFRAALLRSFADSL